MISIVMMPTMLRFAAVATAAAGVAPGCVGRSVEYYPGPPTVEPDGRLDASSVDARPDAPRRDVASIERETAFPPPIEDAAVEDFGAPPPASSHVEAIIGPAGGELRGLPSTRLANVVLRVPAGALASAVLLSVDFEAVPPPPFGVSITGPFVRVGPDATVFDPPARLTVPYFAVVATPQVGVLARVGSNWSSLLDPFGDVGARTITASMRRASGAVPALIDIAAPPRPGAFSPATGPAGTLVFLEGAGFGIAPVWRPATDGGTDFASSVQVGGVVASPLAWGDTAISFRVPEGTPGGGVLVTTPGGGVTAKGSFSVP